MLRYRAAHSPSEGDTLSHAFETLITQRNVQASKESLRCGVSKALEAKLVQQTEDDGLKWSLLKQILKVPLWLPSRICRNMQECMKLGR